jgi:hypothetical protein
MHVPFYFDFWEVIMFFVTYYGQKKSFKFFRLGNLLVGKGILCPII